MQLAAASGVRVIATARPGAEADFVTSLTDGDVQVVDFTGDLAAQVRALAPEGVDAVVHLAGDGVQLTALLKKGGRIASTVNLTQEAVTQDVTVHGVMADTNAQTLTVLAEKAASGSLRVPVTATYPLEQAADAFAAFGAGALGKIAVTCS
ncbi:zinc-binding dehydrogenase [Streptomyces sp. NPDC053750]|uniref:zinc-binding dehydrogenase n=1 Tax=Streptomyces sp. NPDC053750 TaxID=3365714 RepID=UPI0037D39F36